MPPLSKVYVSEDVTGVRFEEGIVVVALREPQGAASTVAFTAKAAAKIADGIRDAVVAAADKAVTGG